jgi:hypothetical protein
VLARGAAGDLQEPRRELLLAHHYPGAGVGQHLGDLLGRVPVRPTEEELRCLLGFTALREPCYAHEGACRAQVGISLAVERQLVEDHRPDDVRPLQRDLQGDRGADRCAGHCGRHSLQVFEQRDRVLGVTGQRRRPLEDGSAEPAAVVGDDAMIPQEVLSDITPRRGVRAGLVNEQDGVAVALVGVSKVRTVDVQSAFHVVFPSLV